MKARNILKWVVKESINGEFLGMVIVPNEGDEEWEQNEQWWIDMFGGVPAGPIEEGEYLYFYSSQIPDGIHTDAFGYAEPDAQIELPQRHGWDYINLYKLED